MTVAYRVGTATTCTRPSSSRKSSGLRVYSGNPAARAVAAISRSKARGRRAFDLLIAATALAAELPLYTRNPGDFDGLDGLIEVVAIARGSS